MATLRIEKQEMNQVISKKSLGVVHIKEITVSAIIISAKIPLIGEKEIRLELDSCSEGNLRFRIMPSSLVHLFDLIKDKIPAIQKEGDLLKFDSNAVIGKFIPGAKLDNVTLCQDYIEIIIGVDI